MSKTYTIQKHRIYLRLKNAGVIEQMIRGRVDGHDGVEPSRAFGERCIRIADYLVLRYRRAHPRCAVGCVDAFLHDNVADAEKPVLIRFFAFTDVANASDRAALQAALDNRTLDLRPYQLETVTNEVAVAA